MSLTPRALHKHEIAAASSPHALCHTARVPSEEAEAGSWEDREAWLPRVIPRPGRRLPLRYRAPRVHLLAEGLGGGLADPEFKALLGKIDGRMPYGDNHLTIYTKGAAAFAAMHHELERAEREILLESYIFSDDGTGRGMCAALAAAARRGVRVSVLVDAVGSAATRRAFWTEMAGQGIEVRRFHPLLPDLLRHPFRDHRKILVIDRRVAFTGGMNIADEYGSSHHRSGGPWRDSHVRAEGPVAWELAVVFAESWRKARGSALKLAPLACPPGSSGSEVLVLDARPNRGHAESAAVFAAIVAAARERVSVTNAYFAPKRIAIEVLGRAARRGVEVRLLLAGRTDVPLVRHAGHGFFAALLAEGVRIFEYQPAVLHAKSLVADGRVSMVGSTNLDFRSFTFNGECNLVVLDPKVAAVMDEAFAEDLTNSQEIRPGPWSRRPLLHKLGDRAARLLTPLL